MKPVFDLAPCRRALSGVSATTPLLGGLLPASVLAPGVLASENGPHRPFAMWADVPEEKQFVVGLVYEESESYHMWAAGRYYNVTVKSSELKGIEMLDEIRQSRPEHGSI